jgi:hypothetical protein
MITESHSLDNGVFKIYPTAIKNKKLQYKILMKGASFKIANISKFWSF